MTPATPMNDGSWGLRGALATEMRPENESLCATPLLDLLRAAAALDPEAIAVTSTTASLSYGALLRSAEQVAHAVAARTNPGQAVACIVGRQPNGIAALLGCLIAARPCMVIDPADPAERREALLRDASPELLLVAERSEFPIPVLTLEAALAEPHRPWRPETDWDADAPFAIHFTSGSTGRPKGVVLSARSVLYRALFGAEAMGVTRDSRVIQPIMPYASAGLSTLLGALLLGGRVVLVDIPGEGAGASLKLIEREAVTTAGFGPATLGMLANLHRARSAFSAMRRLRLGGNSVLSADLPRWRVLLPPDCEILHAYASTEALIMAQWTVPREDRRDESTLPAGFLHSCDDYALWDETGRPAAAGEPGELVLRSRYVALGEWRDGRLVAGRMTPIEGFPGWRLFRTGDMARVGTDGMIRMLGRADRQVKINGVLIQPAEIEAVLKAEPDVADAAVVARTMPSGTALHGFVAATDVDPMALVAALRRRLATSLPKVFRPSHLTVLDRLPMLPSGKIDLIALTRFADG
jgi:acyl-CoA synthetase (AMP-forming)/AMP-acid ligase II